MTTRKAAAIATWADETRNKTTGRWHYVNFPRDVGCTYIRVRDCPGDDCVVEVLKRQLQMYRTSKSLENRLKALRYLVHLVADIHHPSMVVLVMTEEATGIK